MSNVNKHMTEKVIGQKIYHRELLTNSGPVVVLFTHQSHYSHLALGATVSVHFGPWKCVSQTVVGVKCRPVRSLDLVSF